MATSQLHDLFRLAVRLIDQGKDGQLTEEEENKLKLIVIESSRGDATCKSQIEEILLRYLASHLFPGIESLIEKSPVLGMEKRRRYNTMVCGLTTLFCYQIQEGVGSIHRELTKSHVNSELLRETFVNADRACYTASNIMSLVLPGSASVPATVFWTPGPGLCNVKRWLALGYPELELLKTDFTLLNDLILFDTYDPHMWGSKVWPLLHFLVTVATLKRKKAVVMRFLMNNLAYFLPCHSCALEWEELCAREIKEANVDFSSDGVDLQGWLWEMHNKVGSRIGKKEYPWIKYETQDLPLYTELALAIDEF
ncbi:hypothetical protein HDE_00511 [Halotydeus destructor]|nr:hypothetical protein HDE_00511 [Halotydeus destructor]